MKTLSIILAVLALIAAYFFFQIDWEARAVRQQLDRLVELVEKDGPVSQFEALGRSRKLAELFANQPSIEYLPNRRLPADADALSGAFLSIWGQVDTASVWVLRHELEIDTNGMSATSQVTARSSVIMNASEKMGDTLSYRIYWTKIEGAWRIKEVIALGS